jgi:tetratricopeptide (TPR) repeat protein
MGKYDKALESLYEAFKINPKDDMACYYYGYVNYCMEKHEEARKWFNTSNEIKSDDNRVPYDKIVLEDIYELRKISK